MNFVKIINPRTLHLKNVPLLSSIAIGRCSEHVLDMRSCLDVRYFCNRKILSFNKPPITIIKQYKYKKTSKEEEFNEEASDDENEDYNDSKLIVGHVQSLRTDAILKTGLGLARNKVDTYFYDSKIRVNGEKIQKKSQKVKIGDEIDIIQGKSPVNESLLNISRVVLVSVKENEDGDKLKVKLKRYKSLTVEDYTESWNTKEE